MFLTDAEKRELTGRVRPKAQAAALKRMGIRYTINPAGRVVVMRSSVAKRLEGARDEAAEQVKPDFTGLRLVA